MLLDCTTPIRAIDGTSLKDGDKDITLRDVIVRALTEPAMGDDGRPEVIAGPEKLERWALAGKVHGATGPVSLTVEEAAKIKRLVDKMFPGPLVYARVHEAIEAAAGAKKTKT